VLLTVSALILAVVGLYLPKSFEFDLPWMRWLFVVAGLLLLNALTMLVIYIGVSIENTIALDQEEIGLSSDDLKKSQVNSYLLCQVAADNRTSFLLCIYQTARFFALFAFSLIIVLFLIGYITRSGTSDADKTIQQLRSDPRLIELLRGPRGDQGDRGPKGDKGPQGQKSE